jgi:hypothetical protein
MDTFMVNQMSKLNKYYDNILKSYSSLTKTAGNNSTTFEQALNKISAEKANNAEQTYKPNQVSAAQKVSNVPVKDMSLDEYKEYIHDKITNLYLNPLQGDVQYSIQISDEGFERMQKEPEYEKYVLNSIQSNMKFTPYIPFSGATYISLYYDKDISKEHGYGYTLGSEYNNPLCANSTKKSFWEKTAKEKAEAKKLLQLQHDKKCAELEQLNQIALQKSIQTMMLLQNNTSGFLLQQGTYGINAPIMVNTAADQVYSALSNNIMSIIMSTI